MKSSSGGSYNEALGNATNGTDLSGIITCCLCASISVIDWREYVSCFNTVQDFQDFCVSTFNRFYGWLLFLYLIAYCCSFYVLHLFMFYLDKRQTHPRWLYILWLYLCPMYTHVYVDIYTHAPYPCCSLPASPYTLLELLFGLRSHVVSFVRPGLGVCLFL